MECYHTSCRHILRREVRTCVQRRRASCHDILYRESLIGLNRQRAVRTNIAAKLCRMGFQSAVFFGIEICSLLRHDVVLRKNRKILIRGQVAIEFGITTRVDLRHTVRRYCAIYGEIVGCTRLEVAAGRHCAVNSDVLTRCQLCAAGGIHVAPHREFIIGMQAHVARRSTRLHRLDGAGCQRAFLHDGDVACCCKIRHRHRARIHNVDAAADHIAGEPHHRKNRESVLRAEEADRAIRLYAQRIALYAAAFALRDAILRGEIDGLCRDRAVRERNTAIARCDVRCFFRRELRGFVVCLLEFHFVDRADRDVPAFQSAEQERSAVFARDMDIMRTCIGKEEAL